MIMAVTTTSKAQIVAILRSRGLAARADWFDRTLPDSIDIAKNRSLLATLGIDPAALSPAGAVTSGVRGEGASRP
jgi:hypothetical protein